MPTFLNSILPRFLTAYLKKNLDQFQQSYLNPIQAQQETLSQLMTAHQRTEFGLKHQFARIKTYDQFQKQVSFGNYDLLTPYIEQLLRGQTGVLSKNKITYLAITSGTATRKSKLIPISKAFLKQNHWAANQLIAACYFNHYPQSTVLSGKILSLGGGLYPKQKNQPFQSVNISGLLSNSHPWLYDWISAVPEKIIQNPDWHSKLNAIKTLAPQKNVTSLQGIPSNLILLMQAMLEETQQKNIRAIWPNLELIVHGGASMAPHQNRLNELIGDDKVHYLEAYNASEGFYGFEYPIGSKTLTLLTHHGIFYEFMPTDTIGNSMGDPIPLEATKTGQIYELLISTDDGLWRYQTGDLLCFSSTNPYQFTVHGRTVYFLNICNEKVTATNVEQAMHFACQYSGAVVKAFTVGPAAIHHQAAFGHEWLIEFIKPPANQADFMQQLDAQLCQLNSEYEGNRAAHKLTLPQLQILPPGAFERWHQANHQATGQHKTPPLYFSRVLIEGILAANGLTSPNTDFKL